MNRIFIPALCMALAVMTSLSSCKQNDPLTANTQAASAGSQTKEKHTCDGGNDHNNNNCNNNNNNGCGNQNPPSATPQPACGTPTVVNLTNSQHTVVGIVTVSNGTTTLSVTYTTTGSWHLRALHLFVGDISQVPSSWGGTNVYAFPYNVNECNSVNTYTFNIPLTSLANCVSVAAEADVTGSGECFGQQQAWGAGTAITVSGNNNCGGFQPHCGTTCNNNGNNGYYFSYCKQSCTSVCINPPSLLFSGEVAWPNGVTSVVVGGYTYTISTISPVLSEPSNDAQSALFAVATLKIYGSSIYPPSSVTNASTTVEAWLATLGQLTSTSQFTAPANIETAIATIQTWEASDYCH